MLLIVACNLNLKHAYLSLLCKYYKYYVHSTSQYLGQVSKRYCLLCIGISGAMCAAHSGAIVKWISGRFSWKLNRISLSGFACRLWCYNKVGRSYNLIRRRPPRLVIEEHSYSLWDLFLTLLPKRPISSTT